MSDWSIPWLAVAVIKEDKEIFLRGYGVREAGRPEKVDVQTLFGAIVAELLADEEAARHLFVSFRTGRAYVDTKKGFTAACLAAGLDCFTPSTTCATRSPRGLRRPASTPSPGATCWGTPAT